MAYPVTTTITLPLTVLADGSSAGSVEFTVNQYEMSAECSTSALTVQLPAGSWCAYAWIRCLPAEVKVPAVYDSGTQSLPSGGNLTVPGLWLRTYLPLGATGSVFFCVDVYEVQDSVLVPYASTWQDQAASSITIPQAPAARTSGFDWGVACQPIVVVGSAPSYVGSGSPANLAGLLKQLAATGATVTRASVPWALLVPTGTQGQAQTFSAPIESIYDAFFHGCAANGLKAIVQLGSNGPAWASSTGAAGGPCENQSDYENYIDAVLARWGSNVFAVEGANEPNGFTSSGPGWAPTGAPAWAGWTLADFVAEQQTRFQVVRAYSSSLTVSTASIAYGDTAWLGALYAAGGFQGNFDVVSIHPYGLRFDKPGFGTSSGYGMLKDQQNAWGDAAGDAYDTISGCAAIYKVMSENGDGAKSIHVTEFGWSTGRSHWIPGLMSSLDVTEEQQSAYLEMVMQQLARVPYVSLVHLYDFYDTAGYQNGTWGPEPISNFNMFGLVDMLGTRQKPAYATFQQVISDIAAGEGLTLPLGLGTLPLPLGLTVPT